MIFHDFGVTVASARLRDIYPLATAPANFTNFPKTLLLIRDHSLFMTGGGLAKKGVGHEVFLTEKGGGHLKILVQKGGSSYLL